MKKSSHAIWHGRIPYLSVPDFRTAVAPCMRKMPPALWRTNVAYAGRAAPKAQAGLPARPTVSGLPGCVSSGARGKRLAGDLRRRVRSRFARDSLLGPGGHLNRRTIGQCEGVVKESLTESVYASATYHAVTSSRLPTRRNWLCSSMIRPSRGVKTPACEGSWCRMARMGVATMVPRTRASTAC